MKRRIVPGGVLALSLAVVLLAATASTASADKRLALWCAPLPTTPQPHGGCIDVGGGLRKGGFHFGARQVGTTSPAQGFALVIYRREDIFNPRISVSGDYVQTNNCPPTLLEAFCLITVTFAPTSTGPKEGTLRTGPGSPTVTLRGRGVTTATPWDWPLTLDAGAGDWHAPSGLQKLRRSGVVKVWAQTHIGDCLTHYPRCPDYDTRLVLRGDVKKTTKRLEANKATPTGIKARLKHLKQLRNEPTAPKIKVKFKATNEFGQTATERRDVKLCRRIVHVSREVDGETHHLVRCVWHPSRK